MQYRKEKGMKTFDDLEFMPYMSGKRADIKFDNGYTVSVLCGKRWLSNGVDNYDVSVYQERDMCIITDLTNDKIKFVTADEVTAIMAKVQMNLWR